MDSFLSKIYSKEGIDMSGGEKQKIAIARAMYQDASLIILDEPTSALDPISEAEIYEKFSKLIKNKTAIFISHRMSSSVFCDKIIVLDEMTVKDIELFDHELNKLRQANYPGGYLHVVEAQLALARLKCFLMEVEKAKEVLDAK